MKVIRIFSCIDGCLIQEAPPPRQWSGKVGNPIGMLTNLREAVGEKGPAWSVNIVLSDGKNSQSVEMAIERFLTAEEYNTSLEKPISFAEVGSASHYTDPPTWLWLYRDAIYITERKPALSEIEEVILRIKAVQYQRDESLTRLREQVANFEATERNIKNSAMRRPLPDDVKLLTWTRDGGVCVKCGAANELQFDHIIPLARGGGDQAENIQLLCRTCNLAKSDRLT